MFCGIITEGKICERTGTQYKVSELIQQVLLKI